MNSQQLSSRTIRYLSLHNPDLLRDMQKTVKHNPVLHAQMNSQQLSSWTIRYLSLHNPDLLRDMQKKVKHNPFLQGWLL